MVSTRLPKCFISLHSLKSYKNILHRIIECMSHMKLSCYIWWRHNYSKRLLIFSYFSLKIAIIFPLFIKPILQLFRIICFFKFFLQKPLL